MKSGLSGTRGQYTEIIPSEAATVTSMIQVDLLGDILVPRSGKLFALKKSIHRSRGRRDRNLFIREINCVAELKPHKNIVRYDR